MLKLCQAWFSTSATTFEAFWAHPLKNLLAVQERNLPDFWTFGVIYLHLHHDRVSESLWKPHKSKVLNFLHKNYVPTFFPTPTKKYFFSELEKKLKYSFDVKNWELSIYEVFRAIPTLCRDVGANIWHQKFKIPLLDRQQTYVEGRFLKKREGFRKKTTILIFSIPMKYISTKFQVLNRNSGISIFGWTFSWIRDSLL